MSERHIHRFAQFERRKKGLAGALGRTGLVLACQCSMTSEEFAAQTVTELRALEDRLGDARASTEP